jgi:hypothetical protein
MAMLQILGLGPVAKPAPDGAALIRREIASDESADDDETSEPAVE